jgi:hypothetical protein
VRPLAILFWVPTFIVRGILFACGLIVVPFTDAANPVWGNYEDPVPPPWFWPRRGDRFRDYGWRALRNPVNNVRYLFEQPKHLDLWGDPNPEETVRTAKARSASRWIVAGVFGEFWYVWRTKNPERPIGELRIGWKFSPVPGFGPTLQFRRGA